MTPRRLAAGLALAVSLVASPGSAADRLCLIRTDGSGLATLAAEPGWSYGSPDWSPDGHRIAFDTWPEGGEYETTQIAVLDADPGAAERPTLLGDGAMPSWSPDGAQLVCHTYPANSPDKKNHIVVVNTDGSGREAVLDQWGSPRWSPDGRRIVTVFRDGLAAYDLATGRQTILLNGQSVRHGLMGASVQLGFSIAPDGERYGVALWGGGFAIAEDDPVNGGLRLNLRVAPPTYFRHSSWSPDGERLVAMSKVSQDDDAPSRLVVFDAAGDAPPEPVPGIPAEWACLDPDWSPDGEWIVFAVRPVKTEDEP